MHIEEQDDMNIDKLITDFGSHKLFIYIEIRFYVYTWALGYKSFYLLVLGICIYIY